MLNSDQSIEIKQHKYQGKYADSHQHARKIYRKRVVGTTVHYEEQTYFGEL